MSVDFFTVAMREADWSDAAERLHALLTAEADRLDRDVTTAKARKLRALVVDLCELRRRVCVLRDRTRRMLAAWRGMPTEPATETDETRRNA